MEVIVPVHPKLGCLDGIVILKDALPYYFEGLSTGDLWNRCSSIPVQDTRQPILFSTDGKSPILVTGGHPSLMYRGNAVKRAKSWFQSNYGGGLLKYGYTGWQHGIALATRDVASVPVVKCLMDGLNRQFNTILADHKMPPSTYLFNHAIFTYYADGCDNIGLHSDKERDFQPGSYFVVLKLGASRLFSLADSESKIFWEQPLPAGSLVIVQTGKDSPNAKLKHGVPTQSTITEASGSIVFRCIRTVVPWDDVRANISKSKAMKRKRAKKKLLQAADSQHSVCKKRNKVFTHSKTDCK